MRVTTFVRAERAVYVLVDRKPVSEHSSREEAKREAARLAAWVDGPDSEAARAGRAPDPTHTPAVRRVVAWVDSQGDHHEDCGAAYWFSAVDIISRAWFRCPTSLRGASADEWWGRRWPWPRVHRLAAWLRRRDEEAGHR